MKILFIIIGMLAFIGVIVFITNLKNKMELSDEKNKKLKENIGSYFTLKKFFFTQSEKSFFEELKKQNNGQYTILSKVRLEDIVSAKKTLNWKEKGIKRNYIKSRHLDFVILDNHYGNILSVLELDGKSHDTEKQGRYDKIKDDILNSVGVMFYRVKVGEIYENKVKEIFEELEKIKKNIR
jgi:very-short-patch-repair endonuclease